MVCEWQEYGHIDFGKMYWTGKPNETRCEVKIQLKCYRKFESSSIWELCYASGIMEGKISERTTKGWRAVGEFGNTLS